MTIRLFNTLSRKKEPLEPAEPGKIRMYVCGPTVYDDSHIGHARSVVVFDVIVRYLKAKTFDVTYVRNFTDVDDKIIKRAAELGKDAGELAERFIQAFYRDMDALNVQRPDFEPRVTEYVEQIISLVSRLIEKEHAYQVDGDVFFAVETFSEYGKLSGRKLSEMEAGARVEIDNRKRNPFDFALWKSAKPGEPFWDSPWGKGRPGWHIECSAMSSDLLGKTFDIHGGGKDLIFPHHENEIAQSEGAFDKPFAKYWVHNGFVNINQEKMSKSLGNFLMIKDVIKSYHPEAIRLFLLSSQYRSPIDFNQAAMDEATARTDRLYALLQRIENTPGVELDDTGNGDDRPYWHRFCEAMDDDFNTARGIAVLFEAVRRLNGLLDASQEGLSETAQTKLRTGHADILKIGREILGILVDRPEEYFATQRTRSLDRHKISLEFVEGLIKEREAARAAGNWERADEIRNQLEAMEIHLEDRTDGTVWKFREKPSSHPENGMA